jgi:hypothetical protein
MSQLPVIGTLVENLAGGLASAPITVVVPSNGSTIHVITKNNTTPPTGATSNIGGALTQKQSTSGGSFGDYTVLYQLDNAQAGTHVITVTNSAANIRYVGGWYVTNSRLGPSASFDNGAGAGTGANALLTGSITTTLPALVFEVLNSQGGSANPTVGTSPNAFTAITSGVAPGAVVYGYFQQTTAGAINPTGQQTIAGDIIGITFSVYPTYGMQIVTPVEVSPGGASTASITIVMPATGVIVVHTDGQSPPASSVSSNLSGAFTLEQQASNPGSSGLYPAIWKLDSAVAGTHVITLTAPGSTMYYDFAIGIAGAQYDGSAQNFIASSGTGTDVLTSGSVTTTGTDLVFSLQIGVSGGAEPTAGTTPNAMTAIPLTTGNANKTFLEYVQQSAPGAINPTAGATTTGGYQGFTFAVAPLVSNGNAGDFFLFF